MRMRVACILGFG